jgi:hypothetical protein
MVRVGRRGRRGRRGGSESERECELKQSRSGESRGWVSLGFLPVVIIVFWGFVLFSSIAKKKPFFSSFATISRRR